jgi:hypothetical protein
MVSDTTMDGNIADTDNFVGLRAFGAINMGW